MFLLAALVIVCVCVWGSPLEKSCRLSLNISETSQFMNSRVGIGNIKKDSNFNYRWITKN